MKKLIAILISLILSFSVSACVSSKNEYKVKSPDEISKIVDFKSVCHYDDRIEYVLEGDYARELYNSVYEIYLNSQQAEDAEIELEKPLFFMFQDGEALLTLQEKKNVSSNNETTLEQQNFNLYGTFCLYENDYLALSKTQYLSNVEYYKMPDGSYKSIDEKLTDISMRMEYGVDINKYETAQYPTEFKPFEIDKDAPCVLIKGTAMNSDMPFMVSEIYDKHKYYDYRNFFYFLTERFVNAPGKYYLRLPSNAKCEAYIDGAVYINSLEDDNWALYRLPIDENGNYKLDEFSVVTDYRAEIAFVGENKLILRVDNVDGAHNPHYLYRELNTLTGEITDAKGYNEILAETPKGFISKNKAIQIAIDKINSRDYESSEYVHEKAVRNMAEAVELIYNIDPLACGYYDTRFEDDPEYSWNISVNINENEMGTPYFNFCIDAKTGKIAAMHVVLPD